MPELKPQDIIERNLGKAVDYSNESGPCLGFLQRIANREKCGLLAFIAPYAAVRVSPVETRSASIGTSEEFGIIGAIDKLVANGAKGGKLDKLCLLINSPGGYVHSSYKIAKTLRKTFKHIKVFVPHLAASGGTLMALIGNEIVMGRMSQLTPIDVQVSYKDDYVSANSMIRALSRLSDFFSKTTQDEAPYPWKSMAEKLDPVLLEHWNSGLVEIGTYAKELLTLSGYKADVIDNILRTLVFPASTHGLVVDRDAAKKIKLRLSDSTQDQQDLKVMEAWLTDYLLKAADKHVIRYVTPGGSRDGKAKAKKARARRPKGVRA